MLSSQKKKPKHSNEQPHKKRQMSLKQERQTLHIDETDCLVIINGNNIEKNLDNLEVAWRCCKDERHIKPIKMKKMTDIGNSLSCDFSDSCVRIVETNHSSKRKKQNKISRSETRSCSDNAESIDIKMKTNPEHSDQNKIITENIEVISNSKGVDCESRLQKHKRLKKYATQCEVFDRIETIDDTGNHEVDDVEMKRIDEHRTADPSYQCMTKNDFESNNKQLVEFRSYNTMYIKFWQKICLNLRQQGKKFNSGHFSREEDEQLTKNWRRFIEKCPFEPPHVLLLRGICGYKRRDLSDYIKDTNFYIKLGKHINRPLSACFFRARKLFHPAKHKGRFSQEESEFLMRMFSKHGPRWARFSHIMDRRDDLLAGHFRTIKSNYARGPWKKEEDRQLIAAVKSKILDCTDSSEAFFNLPWTEIALMVPTRYSTQCRVRWTQVLAFGKIGKQRFSLKYQMRLIQEIIKQNLSHECEIDWIHLASRFNIPSPQFLQNRFRYLRNMIPNYQLYSFNDNLETIAKRLLSRKSSKTKGHFGVDVS